jgi:phosphate starvation-inducible protein PhoH
LIQTEKLSKSARRKLRKQGVVIETGMSLPRITPKTESQERVFKLFNSGKNVFSHGSAGSGKTFISMYLGLKEVLKQNYERIVIVRSVVPSRNIGFLPGSHLEKIKLFEEPYYDICADLFDRGDAYDILKQRGKIVFLSTSFLRGINLDNSIVIIDECQNMNWQEFTTVLTRVKDNVRVMLCGDTKQSDLDSRSGKGDISKMLDVARTMDSMGLVNFTSNDVVRSGFVYEFIHACEELGY